MRRSFDAAAFNELCNHPDTVIVDMRNHYESEIGHFENAITPDVVTSRIIANHSRTIKSSAR